MNEENYFKATSNLSRIRESGLLRFTPRIVCNSCRRRKKQRASRLFIFLSSSKEQGNRTGNPKFACGSFKFPSCIPCPAGLRPPVPAPDGRLVWGRLTTFPLFSRWSHVGQVVSQAASSPGGRFRFVLPGYLNSRKDSITFKCICYGK
ncbi:hypothetical protein [Viscerimonas tarda]